MSISLLSPAKVNLFLHILGRRADGYHRLQTLFQLLNYGDDMEFGIRDDGVCRLESSVPGVTDNDNLIIKAARALQKHTQTKLGADIGIVKRLPIGGGLGGGSSNAATTLVALNHLWQTQLNKGELSQLGVNLGADVPVFIQGQSSWAEGIGEQLQAVDLPKHWFLVIKPDCEISTGAVFSHEELTRGTPAITVSAFFEQGGRNDCEAVVCKRYPEVANAIKWLRKHAPVQLTGTGACVFASFANQREAEIVMQEVPSHWECFVAQGINQSPVLSLLP